MSSDSNKSPRRKGRSGARRAISFLVPVVAMSAFGAYVGLMTDDETRTAYLIRLKEGLTFAIGPLIAAGVLVALFRLPRLLFRSRRPPPPG